MEIQGKVAVVTGGAQGIGFATAQMLAAQGAKVAILDINQETLDAAATELGADAIGVQCNVANEKSVADAFAKVVETFGHLDIAVLNAGILRDGLLIKVDRATGKVKARMPLEQWQSVIDVNLTGAFLTGREAATKMIEGGNPGVIVAMSSIARHGNIGQTPYSATKAGVATLCVTWGRELARYKIRVMGVAPGLIGTPMVLKDMKPEMLDKVKKMIPVRRLGKPEEIAHTIRFIIENDMMTASVVEPSGGMKL